MSTRNPHRDACPECLARDVDPTATLPTPTGQECLYRCALCAHIWRTAWRLDA